MELVQVDQYEDARRAIERKKEYLESYALREFLTPEEKEALRYVISALDIARSICFQVREMAIAANRGSRRVARERYAEACKLAEIFWACVIQLEIEAIYTYEFLTPIVNDFPRPFGP